MSLSKIRPCEEQSLKDRLDLQRVINPNVYLVLQLSPMGLFSDTTPEGLPMEDTHLPWTLERFEKVAYKYVASVSQRALGKTAYRKRPPHRKRLPNVTTLESPDTFPHLNICLRYPEKFSFSSFSEICREEFDRIRGFRRYEYAFYCEPAHGGCAVYSTKKGAIQMEMATSYCS